jgi:hypothetical protein
MIFTEDDIKRAINFGGDIEAGNIEPTVLNYGSYAEYFIKCILKKADNKEAVKVVNPELQGDQS